MMMEMVVVVHGDHSADDGSSAYIDRNSTQNNDGSTNQHMQ